MQFISKALGGDDKEAGQPGPEKRIMAALLGLIKAPGGLEGLLGKFRSAGMEDKVASWVSKGESVPATAEDVKKALGDEKIAQIAKEAGVSEEEASSQLATMIPATVNEFTADGHVPDQSKLDGLLDSISDKVPQSLRRFIPGGSH